ncbi:MAG: flippase-like domain-containing protein [Bacteroidetes bacterium]|nr:flippase-like domain-containing protein [Bacteroidota bacterium]MBP7398292.1 flippase-like domain-containing protein [Chitinophagales bacterium]MBK8680810.1 flippase-like domain-containing protein [Bacteroidota bacterium]MBP8753592.1 flippase-like domain-containing protein [Chitinophagales bacterium]MBP9188640.1 flippase-like domain-containing protein [Chitinophagales bacterium]
MKLFKGKNQVYSILIKVAILGLLIFALYKQLIGNSDVKSALQLMLESINSNDFLLLFSVTILMLLNWGVESYKWKNIISKIYNIPFIQAFKAVWTGVTLGLFTPNRIGEYGGRILYLPMRHRISSIIATLIGSFGQIVVTSTIGIITLIIFLLTQTIFDTYITWMLIGICIVLDIVFFAAYFNLHIFIEVFKRKKFFSRILPYITIIGSYHNQDLWRYLGLSAIRYSVFTAQYLAFLKLFGVHLNVGEGVLVIGLIFLAQTIIPSFAIAELFTRGNIAVYFCGFYSENTVGVFAASTCLWLLNLIIPAILGYTFIIKKNFLKQTGNE